jgi:hypothetical protein
MTNEAKHRADALALERHLETYGADQRRWPLEARERFAPLLAGDPGARTLLAEARALDRLLNCAPVPSACRERALSDRIVAAISNQRDRARTAERAARMIEMPGKRQVARTVAPGIAWQAAALLAAALAIGVYVGAAGGLAPEVQAVAEVVGFETQADTSQLSLLDDNAAPSEEDLL